MLKPELNTLVGPSQAAGFHKEPVTSQTKVFDTGDTYANVISRGIASVAVSDNYVQKSSSSCTPFSLSQNPFAATNAPRSFDDSSSYISTLVFFDLETTGLGNVIGKANVQVTEISMIAVDRNEFSRCVFPDLRDVRVVHKLSMCVKPRSNVSPVAKKLTGLDDDNLYSQHEFDENTASAIISFLSHLRKPVCLLAHNGTTFDFPLLKAEFQRLHIHFPSEFHIADTLLAFKAAGARDLPSVQSHPKSIRCKNGRLSLALENLHIYFFGKKHQGGHSSEGDCIALAKICHKMREHILPWIDRSSIHLDAIKPMW